MKLKPYQQIRQAFNRWLSLPDTSTVDMICSVVLANRLPGDPVWMVVVGAASSGKTEIVRALEALDDIISLDIITPASFGSGYRTQDSDVQHGLLARIQGETKIITIEDFSTVFKDTKDDRGKIFARLRKIYDGKATFGPYGNGVEFKWEGKVGMLCCATGSFDRQITQESEFGDRFLLWRGETSNPVSVADRAARNASKKDKMRKDLMKTMSLLNTIKTVKAPEITRDVTTYISKLCHFVATARTHVPRDQWFKTIVDMPEIEGTARMSGQLNQALKGIMLYKDHATATREDVQLIERLAYSSIPKLRFTVLQAMDLSRKNSRQIGTQTKDLQKRTRIPKTTLYRTLEDLAILGILDHRADPGNLSKGAYYVPKAWIPHVYYTRKDAKL